MKVTVDEGAEKGTKAAVGVPPEVIGSRLAKGDRLVLLRTPARPANRPSSGTSRSSVRRLVRAFASSIGLVLAVPVTTAIAVATVPGPPDPLGF